MADYSLADMAAATGEGGFGGANAWVMIILFALIFGWGGGGLGFGAGRGPAEQPVTEGGLCNAMNFNNLENAVGRLSDKEDLHMMQLSQGLSSVGYENLRNFADTQASVKDGDYAISRQLADCCCTTQRGIDGVNYNIQQQGCETREAVAQSAQKVLDAITGNRMADMQNQISALQLQSAMCGVVRYPNATTYTAGASPFFGQQGCCGYGYGAI